MNLILAVVFLMTEVRGVIAVISWVVCNDIVTCVLCSAAQGSIVVSDWYLSEW